MKTRLLVLFVILAWGASLKALNVPVTLEGAYEVTVGANTSKRIPPGEYRMVVMNHPGIRGSFATIHSKTGVRRFTYRIRKVALDGKYILGSTPSKADVPSELRFLLDPKTRRVVGRVSLLSEEIEVRGVQQWSLAWWQRYKYEVPTFNPVDIEGHYVLETSNSYPGQLQKMEISRKTDNQYEAVVESRNVRFYFKGWFDQKRATFKLYRGPMKWVISYRKDREGKFGWHGSSLSAHNGISYRLKLRVK